MRLAGASLAIAVAASACLFPDLSTLNEAPSGKDGGTDVGTDAPNGPVAIANAQQSVAPSGNAQQTHVVWANVAKRWWLFYFDDDTTLLKTRTSADFVAWQDGPSLTLAHTNAGEGRNLSVAYAELGGVDVVHISISHAVGGSGPLIHSHTRAVISGSTITFGAPSDVCSIDASPDEPDGNAAYVASDGTVWDSTGFVASAGTGGKGYQNEDAFLSPSQDDGTSWTNSFNQMTIEVVNTTANSRAFFSAGDFGAIWEAGDQDPNPTNLHFAFYEGGNWTSPDSLFDDDAPQDPNDWGLATLQASTGPEVHVVRALLAGGYEHAYGTSTTGQNGAAPPTQSRTAGTGVVVLADPSHVAAFDLSSAGELVESRWDGSTWSAWTTIASAMTPSYLSGYCPNLDAHPEAGGCAVIWTGPSTDGVGVFGQLVSVR